MDNFDYRFIKECLTLVFRFWYYNVQGLLEPQTRGASFKILHFLLCISYKLISSRCVEQQMLHIGAISGTDMAQFISTDDCGSSLYRFYYGCTSVE